ncbi:hypothetical protein [Paraburkholderia acidicola]|nr:hypothetical protein [Paraburkholderia acidicola]
MSPSLSGLSSKPAGTVAQGTSAKPVSVAMRPIANFQVWENACLTDKKRVDLAILGGFKQVHGMYAKAMDAPVDQQPALFAAADSKKEHFLQTVETTYARLRTDHTAKWTGEPDAIAKVLSGLTGMASCLDHLTAIAAQASQVSAAESRLYQASLPLYSGTHAPSEEQTRQIRQLLDSDDGRLIDDCGRDVLKRLDRLPDEFKLHVRSNGISLTDELTRTVSSMTCSAVSRQGLRERLAASTEKRYEGIDHGAEQRSGPRMSEHELRTITGNAEQALLELTQFAGDWLQSVHAHLSWTREALRRPDCNKLENDLKTNHEKLKGLQLSAIDLAVRAQNTKLTRLGFLYEAICVDEEESGQGDEKSLDAKWQRRYHYSDIAQDVYCLLEDITKICPGSNAYAHRPEPELDIPILRLMAEAASDIRTDIELDESEIASNPVGLPMENEALDALKAMRINVGDIEECLSGYVDEAIRERRQSGIRGDGPQSRQRAREYAAAHLDTFRTPQSNEMPHSVTIADEEAELAIKAAADRKSRKEALNQTLPAGLSTGQKKAWKEKQKKLKAAEVQRRAQAAGEDAKALATAHQRVHTIANYDLDTKVAVEGSAADAVVARMQLELNEVSLKLKSGHSISEQLREAAQQLRNVASGLRKDVDTVNADVDLVKDDEVDPAKAAATLRVAEQSKTRLTEAAVVLEEKASALMEKAEAMYVARQMTMAVKKPTWEIYECLRENAQIKSAAVLGEPRPLGVETAQGGTREEGETVQEYLLRLKTPQRIRYLDEDWSSGELQMIEREKNEDRFLLHVHRDKNGKPLACHFKRWEERRYGNIEERPLPVYRGPIFNPATTETVIEQIKTFAQESPAPMNLPVAGTPAAPTRSALRNMPAPRRFA